MKVVSIVGARPQFIKAAPVSRTFSQTEHTEILVHTGQHYDPSLSAVFFDELGIPTPNYNLGVGSNSHGAQTSAMLEKIEQVLFKEKPDWTLVYGDTNSTLAGALAAAKVNIPVAHVEAGLRSYNRRMPEEINRVITDHISDLLLCPSDTAAENLKKEGIHRNVHVVGDVMYEALNYAVEKAKNQSTILGRLSVNEKKYFLVTLHRVENTDHPENLKEILSAFSQIGTTIIFPIHPRTQKALDRFGFKLSDNIIPTEPLGYLDNVRLMEGAQMIITDSGGLQKEAYWLHLPCITLRNETEWVETVETGWNRLVGAKKDQILEAILSFSIPKEHPQLYASKNTAEQCVTLLSSASFSEKIAILNR
jgi:UDP-GlcNAc3NAcA epimerase